MIPTKVAYLGLVVYALGAVVKRCCGEREFLFESADRNYRFSPEIEAEKAVHS